VILTPVMCTTKFAPGAAKFLLNWSSTDVNITTLAGVSFLDEVREARWYFFSEIVVPDHHPELVQQHEFLHLQWRDIEDMLVERGAVDTGITMVE
jgi:hypothetical protein